VEAWRKGSWVPVRCQVGPAQTKKMPCYLPPRYQATDGIAMWLLHCRTAVLVHEACERWIGSLAGVRACSS
jgi:hypothetical protein